MTSLWGMGLPREVEALDPTRDDTAVTNGAPGGGGGANTGILHCVQNDKRRGAGMTSEEVQASQTKRSRRECFRLAG
jgi:hypothetical protein